ncbi:Rho GTPase-activating protein 20 [Echinococcus granulosus]|nr:Rho GTPase-activating protein 20 [Echinococcus granulosus]
MPILQNIKSCVRRKHGVTRRPTKVHFNVKIVDAFKSANVASQLRDLLVYIAREGVAVTDLFRRPGNIQSIKKIVSDLESGRPINWTDYNFYTLANIAKRFLLHIEGGILGEEAEEALIEALDIPDIDARNAQMKSIITSQPKMVQQLLTLLFGTWFRMIYHTDVNAMSVEAVAKSVAGSIFPSCTYSPEKVEKASKVMEVLIVGFASTELFGRELIEYFTRETNTSISRVEKFKYEFRFPKNIPKPRSTQMFRQVLIEESKKHGFDILKDEVTKEEFECANQPMALDWSELQVCPTSANKDCGGGGGDTLGRTTDSVFIPSRTHSLRVPLATLQPTTQSTPVQCPLPPPPHHLIGENGVQNGRLDYLGHHHDHIDQVQQYSEKRTCITAAPAGATDVHLRRRDSSGMAKSLQGASQSISDTLGRKYDSLSEMDDLSRFNGAGAAAAYGSCFNTVKKRQLERLQKRSDWFLSPPAGLRNSGMMRVDLPPASGNPRNPPKLLKGENGEEVCRKCTASDDHPIVLRRKPSNRQSQHQQSQGGVCSIYCNTHVPSASRQFTLPSPHADDEVKCVAAAAGGVSNMANGIADTSAVTGATSANLPSDDELLETRYFVAVKYYGPDPSSSIRNALFSPYEREDFEHTATYTPLRP